MTDTTRAPGPTVVNVYADQTHDPAATARRIRDALDNPGAGAVYAPGHDTPRIYAERAEAAAARRAMGDLHHLIHLVGQLYGKPLGTALAGDHFVELQKAVDALEQVATDARSDADRWRNLSIQHDEERAEAQALVAEYRRRFHARSLAIQAIEAERARHRDAEGWTPEHDDLHTDGELALAAATYALPRTWRRHFGGQSERPACWPWLAKDWKPTPRDRKRELVKAGALIVAELERLARAEVAAEVDD